MGSPFFCSNKFACNYPFISRALNSLPAGEEAVDLSLAFQEAGGPSAWYVEPMRLSLSEQMGFLAQSQKVAMSIFGM